MTIDKQPRALYLADVLAAGFECDQEWYEIESAKEMRRLHAENEDYGATIDYLTCENAELIGEIVALKEQRDELLESLATCRANFRRHEEETIKMAQAEDEERASLRAQRDALLEALKAMLEVHGVTQEYADKHIEIPQSWVEVSNWSRAAIAKATGETKLCNGH